MIHSSLTLKLSPKMNLSITKVELATLYFQTYLNSIPQIVANITFQTASHRNYNQQNSTNSSCSKILVHFDGKIAMY